MPGGTGVAFDRILVARLENIRACGAAATVVATDQRVGHSLAKGSGRIVRHADAQHANQQLLLADPSAKADFHLFHSAQQGPAEKTVDLDLGPPQHLECDFVRRKKERSDSPCPTRRSPSTRTARGTPLPSTAPRATLLRTATGRHSTLRVNVPRDPRCSSIGATIAAARPRTLYP